MLFVYSYFQWRFTFESEHSRIRFMENFKHFVLFDRRKIERFLKKKKSLRFIAGKFGRSVSSVSDEISRKFVKDNLRYDQSPEGISGRLKYVEDNLQYASAKAIYKFVYSPNGRLVEKF